MFDIALDDNVEKARELLHRCLTDPEKTHRDDVALQRAAVAGAVRFIRLLLAAGANPRYVDGAGRTSLSHAARPTNTHIGADHREDREHARAGRLLIAAGAAVNHRSKGGSTALHGAAAFGMAATVRMLLAHGAAVDRRNSLGNTALLMAAFNGHSDVVLQLLAAGAQATVRNDEGYSAADLAHACGFDRLVRHLERHGAEFDPSSAARILGCGDG